MTGYIPCMQIILCVSENRKKEMKFCCELWKVSAFIEAQGLPLLYMHLMETVYHFMEIWICILRFHYKTILDIISKSLYLLSLYVMNWIIVLDFVFSLQCYNQIWIKHHTNRSFCSSWKSCLGSEVTVTVCLVTATLCLNIWWCCQRFSIFLVTVAVKCMGAFLTVN